jgi:hypothetical protein
VKLSPAKIAIALSLIVCSLLLAHTATQALRVYGGYEFQLGFQRQFNLDLENNIPSWYASSALFFCALLLGVIGVTKQHEHAPRSRQWFGLAMIFLYLSLDEAASLHEMVIPMGRTLLNYVGVSSGYLHFAWVIFGIIAVSIVGFSYLRFLRALPRSTGKLFVIAGMLYVAGALGVEMFGGKVASQGGMDTMLYAVLVAVEEGLEMFGIVLFSYALLSYIGQREMAASLLRMHQDLFVRSGDNGSASAVPSRTNGQSRPDRAVQSASPSVR